MLTPSIVSFDDAMQTSLEPFVSLADRRVFARAGVRVALDNPLGFGPMMGNQPPEKLVAGNLQVGVRM